MAKTNRVRQFVTIMLAFVMALMSSSTSLILHAQETVINSMGMAVDESTNGVLSHSEFAPRAFEKKIFESVESTSNLQATGFVSPVSGSVPPDAIRITTAAQLAAIGGPQSAGRYYYLGNNIYLTSEWVPIDDFRGTFDGQGFTINNLFVLASSQRQYAGLFGLFRKIT